MRGKERTLQYVNVIDNKEMQMLIAVMHKYNFQLVSAEKIRSVYKITTKDGEFCLKRVKHGKAKIESICVLAEELRLNKFKNVAKYLRTKDGTFYVGYKKEIFYLTEWLEGTECDLTNIDEAVNCTKLLGQFHNVSNKIDGSKIHIPNNLKNLPKEFASSLNDIEKFKRIIMNKRIKNEFDVLFLENIESYYNRGISALNMLNKSQYYKASKVSNGKKMICQHSFYYQKIIKRQGEYFMVDLDNIMIDLPVSDLGEFVRRLMFKEAYGWNFNFAKILIEAYNFTNRLSKEDLEVMLALIIFPYKFWKLGKKRYMKQREWPETKYLHKLNKIIGHNETQEKFFYDYLDFLKEYS